MEEKSNEIDAIPSLLELLDVRGVVVTIDAIGTQKQIADQIISQQADYILSVKKRWRAWREAMVIGRSAMNTIRRLRKDMVG